MVTGETSVITGLIVEFLLAKYSIAEKARGRRQASRSGELTRLNRVSTPFCFPIQTTLAVGLGWLKVEPYPIARLGFVNFSVFRLVGLPTDRCVLPYVGPFQKG